MCKFIGKSNERILCKLSKSEILRLYSIVHVAMETTKTSNFTCQSKSFISIFFTCQVSACELQPFLDMIWQMTYTHKLPKQCSATLTGSIICTNACSETLFPPRFLSCDLWWALPGKGIRSMGNGLNLEAHVISRWKEILQVIVLLNRTICAVVIFRFKETWWLLHWSWKRQSLSTTLLIST